MHIINTSTDLQKQLKRQLDFLSRSCNLFDQGYKDEAIRIAVTLRTLFHDTNKSISLLTMLNLKQSIMVASSCYPHTVVSNHYMFALDPLTKFGDNKELVPILGSKKTAWFMAAEDWWKNSTVVILVPGECVSRKDIVLAAANKDGGTHVDKLPEKYDYLNRGFWQTGKNWHSGHQFVLLRQLAFEVLKSPELTSIVSWQES